MSEIAARPAEISREAWITLAVSSLAVLAVFLDTTVLFAAIFEHIGLNPILFLVPGHAFVGYWRVSRNLPQSVTPLSEAMNYIDTNFIGLIETTAIAFGKTFAEMPVDVKNENSHRGQSSRQMLALMRERWFGG
jgi:hypothetical protein